MKGLFDKVRNKQTRQRFVVSTIRKSDELFETAVFAANLLFIPRHLSKPELAVETRSLDEAWDLHYEIAARLAQEYPPKLFEEYRS